MKGLAQAGHVDGVAAFFHQVHHVQRHHHRDAQLQKLGGEVEVALQVGAVHHVDDGAWTLLGEVIPGDDLLWRVGGEGVDARQILDHHIRAALELALFFLDGDARPVAHILGGAGKGVKQRGFPAVGVACQGDGGWHGVLLSKLVLSN